jgi:hypothetical protein
VARLELLLLSPDLRGDSSSVRQLLDPDFQEFGASGKAWNADQMVAELERDPGDSTIRASDLNATRLGPDTVLLTYLARSGRSRSWRSSVWRRAGNGGWQVLFHQGTPLDPISPR